MGNNPMHHPRYAAQTWMYPAGVPERGYQLSIIRTALLNNTLVCLPTGLGKTLIAAVVMYNFTRWFPEARSWHAQIHAFLLHAVSDAWMCHKSVFLLDFVASPSEVACKHCLLLPTLLRTCM